MNPARATVAIEPAILDRDRLVIRFAAPHRVLSWAIAGGGLRVSSGVVWREVSSLPPGVDPRAIARQALDAAGLPDGVALLTARNLATFEEVRAVAGPLSARCVATVGLSNALAAGDPPGPMRPIGTINLLCQVTQPLSDEALIEASALVAEARTAALIEAGVRSRRTGRAATGTGTDCIVVAAPRRMPSQLYAGKHTPIGALVGQSVREAVARGAARWLEELAR
jgi:adenosylcobinamide amidohydrolase